MPEYFMLSLPVPARSTESVSIATRFITKSGGSDGRTTAIG